MVQKPRALHVINAPSPAATASLAIAEEIVGRIGLN
jgi:L-2-hydroxyglutarate oxidase